MLWGGEFVKNFMKTKTAGLFVQYKALVIMAVYAVFYLAAFFYLERRTVAVHEINFAVDAYIPFCEVDRKSVV